MAKQNTFRPHVLVSTHTNFSSFYCPCSQDIFSLTDDQRGAILHAEHKVKQLQDTVFSLSNRLFLATKINEEMDPAASGGGGSDGGGGNSRDKSELKAANGKIKLLLEQVKI